MASNRKKLVAGASTGGSGSLSGAGIIGALKAGGIEFVVSVPDITTSEGLLRPITHDPELRLVRICKEDEGVAICTGLAFCDRRALLLIQNTGLMDSLNAVRAVAVEYEQPVCMMVGLQGKEPDRKPRDSAKYGVRIVEPILEIMGIDQHLIETEADIAKIRPAIDAAYALSRPLVFLIGRSPSAP
jgi:sulfopyruvate decarboxylase subunit alpha